MIKKRITLLLMACSLNACSIIESRSGLNQPPMVDVGVLTGANAPNQESGNIDDVLAQLPGDEPEVMAPAIYEGTDQMVISPPTRQAIQLLGEDVILNYEQVPLMDVVQGIMGDILGLDYIIDVPIPGDVTVRTSAPVPRDQALVILESLLESRQASIARLSDGRFFITGSEAAFRIAPSMSSVDSEGIGSGIVIIPLEYISAADMADILGPVADASAFIRVDQVRNLLMMAGTRIQVNGWLDIISTFDVDMLAGMSVGIYPIEYSEVGDIQEALEVLLDGTGAGTEAGANANIGEEGAGSFSSLVRIVPLDDLNSLMVVTPRKHYLAQVEKWIGRLDQPPSSGVETELFVYPVLNRTVGELAELLTKIYSGESSTGNGNSNGVAPGLTPQRVSSNGNNNAGNTGNNNSEEGDGTSSYAYNVGDARVVADEGNNALLIYATGRDYRRISRALQQLDKPPTQVLIEASIIEVSLSNGLQYGFQWAFDNEIGSNDIGVGTILPNSVPETGLGYTITNALSTDLVGTLKALAGNSLLNVISTPSLMVLDNYTAKLEAGSSVPYNAATFVDGSSDFLKTSVEYRDVGVNLEVTPTVNAGGLVTMEISVSVTDIGVVDDVTSQRQFDNREMGSQVAVRSGQTVVLGGLIRDKRDQTKGGVPILYNLPFIGGFFGSTNIGSEQTELVVLITPTVIYNDRELKEVSDNYRSGIRNLDLIFPDGDDDE